MVHIKEKKNRNPTEMEDEKKKKLKKELSRAFINLQKQDNDIFTKTMTILENVVDVI